MNDPAVYVGPVANSFGGADIAWIVGFVFAGIVYYIGARAGIAVSARLGRGPDVPTESPA